MIQQSLDVLANYQQNAIPHDQVEAWITSSHAHSIWSKAALADQVH